MRKQSCILNQFADRILLYKEPVSNILRRGVIHLSVKERILTIRLMEKVLKMPDKAESLGIRVKMDSRNDGR